MSDSNISSTGKAPISSDRPIGSSRVGIFVKKDQVTVQVNLLLEELENTFTARDNGADEAMQD